MTAVSGLKRGISLLDAEARRARRARSAGISNAIIEDRKAVRGLPKNPYLRFVSITSYSTVSSFLALFGGSLILNGMPSPVASIPLFLTMPFLFLGDRMIYLSRLRRGKVVPATVQVADLGELQAESLSKEEH